MGAPRCLALAVLAAVAACTAAQLTPRANPGGPAILHGISDISTMDPVTDFPVTLAVGYVLGGVFNYTHFHPATKQVHTETGKYQSWECGTASGTFTAILDVTTIANGTETTKTVCQFGEVYLMQQQFSWVVSETECPTALPESGYFTTTLYSVDQGGKFECGEAFGIDDGIFNSAAAADDDYGEEDEEDDSSGAYATADASCAAH